MCVMWGVILKVIVYNFTKYGLLIEQVNGFTHEKSMHHHHPSAEKKGSKLVRVHSAPWYFMSIYS